MGILPVGKTTMAVHPREGEATFLTTRSLDAFIDASATAEAKAKRLVAQAENKGKARKVNEAKVISESMITINSVEKRESFFDTGPRCFTGLMGVLAGVMVAKISGATKKMLIEKTILVAGKIESETPEEEIANESGHAKLLGLAALILTESGFKDRAQEIFREALRIAVEIEDISIRRDTLRHVAKSADVAGFLDAAVEIRTFAQSPGTKKSRQALLKKLFQ